MDLKVLREVGHASQLTRESCKPARVGIATSEDQDAGAYSHVQLFGWFMPLPVGVTKCLITASLNALFDSNSYQNDNV